MLSLLRHNKNLLNKSTYNFSKLYFSTIDISLKDCFEVHGVEDTLNDKTIQTDRDELLDYFQTMYRMRRMEITCDSEYKARTIRGFCHLYDGQEAVAVGTNAGLTVEDSWITSYRCHGAALLRGGTVESIFSEMFGYEDGMAGGKGGSMHLYSKKHNFYGGAGIVGAQVPLGAGLAFASKYQTPEGEPSPVAVTMYGDGAANQGQVMEAANMASLWKLPCIFIVENNHYGMGTSIDRSTHNMNYYTMGNTIPGLRVNGMNVFSVREGIAYSKKYASEGNGPMFIEMMTYRYHGHSMSDPGTTYRDRKEIDAIRKTRDPIDYVKTLLIDNELATKEEIKTIEKDIRNEVKKALKTAKSGKLPDANELYTDIIVDDEGKPTIPDFVRMPIYEKSIRK